MEHLSGKITRNESFGYKIFKTQERFMATSSCKSRRIGVCSFKGHISRENHEADFRGIDEIQISPSKTSSTEHRIMNEVAVTDLVVLGLPAFNVKGERSEKDRPKDVSENNPKVSSQSALPIKSETKSFEDIGFAFAHEKYSYNLLNAAERSALPVKIKAEAPKEAETSVALEKHVEKFPNFSQLRTVNVCFSEADIQEKSLPLFSTFPKHHNKVVIVSDQSRLPIKIEPISFEDSKFHFSHEKNSCNRLNTSELPGLPINVKDKTLEVAEASVVLEKYVEKLSNFSQLSSSISSCFSEDNIRENFFPHFSISQESTSYSLSSEINIPEDLHFPSAGNMSTKISNLDIPLSGTSGLIIPHPEKVDVVFDCPWKDDENFPVMEDRGCFDQSSYLETMFYAGKPQSTPLSSGSSLKVKPETVDSNQTCQQIPPCNKGEQLFEYKTDLPSDSTLDILDHVPLKYRLGNSGLSTDFPTDLLNHVPLKYRMGTSELPRDTPLDILDNVPLKYRLVSTVSEVGVHGKSDNIFSEEIPPTSSGCHSFGSASAKASLSSRRRKKEIASVTSDCCSFGFINVKANIFSRRRKKKKTATDSVERAMEEDAPGLLQVLLDRGIQIEEIKLYCEIEDNDPVEETSYDDSFEDLETLMTKLFSEHSSLMKLTSGQSMKRSKAVYCVASLISLIEQCRYLLFRQAPAEWGWCRDLHSFIFVFKTHNRIVLERPEYGYATYFFELVSSLPIDWQMKRLVIAMKLTNCSRTILLENKPLIVGEDLSEGEARVLEAYGWTPNTGFGTLLNYCDRVVHDRRNETCNVDWRAKIGKLLMDGHDGGCLVLTNLPRKVVEYMGSQNSETKLEL